MRRFVPAPEGRDIHGVKVMSAKKNSPKTPGENPPEKKKKMTGAEEAAEKKAEAEAAVKAEDKEITETAAEEKPAEPDFESLLKAEKDKYLRLLAEYDNYRKRSTREREGLYGDVRADTVAKFLPVFDNLQRALDQSTKDEAYKQGVLLIMSQFRDVLKELGVTEIEALGKTFDPTLHEAVMHEDDPEKGEGEVTLELRRGFRMGDRVIRFSMVKTAN